MIDFIYDPTVGFVSAVLSVALYLGLLLYRERYQNQGTKKVTSEVTDVPLDHQVDAEAFEQVVESEPTKLDIQPAESSPPSPPHVVAPVQLKDKLQKTRTSFFGSIAALFSGTPKLSEDLIEEFQFLLVSADLGIKATSRLIDNLKATLARGETLDEEILVERLKTEINQSLDITGPSVTLETITPGQASPHICLVVGVNGVGKTTTTAKLASRLKARGVSVLLVAADTFRAAAVEQLQTWGQRLSVPVVTGIDANAKPQTVVFEAMKQAAVEAYDVILIDTAGRLNNKSNLMQELAGIKNAVERHFVSGVNEVLMVVDGTTGQNAVSQAKEFHSVVNLTGLIITKLDGTPKGGVVVAVSDEISIPVQYIGVGEAAEDLRPFIREEFVEALFSRAEKTLAEDSAHAETRKRKRRAA